MTKLMKCLLLIGACCLAHVKFALAGHVCDNKKLHTNNVNCGADEVETLVSSSGCGAFWGSACYDCCKKHGLTYDYYAYSWGSCSATCGGGTQTRTVQCQSGTSSSTAAADGACAGKTKPSISQSCNTQACSNATNTTGACSAACPDFYISDGECDDGCNVAACGWDGGDCSQCETSYFSCSSGYQRCSTWGSSFQCCKDTTYCTNATTATTFPRVAVGKFTLISTSDPYWTSGMYVQDAPSPTSSSISTVSTDTGVYDGEPYDTGVYDTVAQSCVVSDGGSVSIILRAEKSGDNGFRNCYYQTYSKDASGKTKMLSSDVYDGAPPWQYPTGDCPSTYEAAKQDGISWMNPNPEGLYLQYDSSTWQCDENCQPLDCKEYGTYSYTTGSWGSCSASCGGGTQTRSVTCKRSDGQSVSDSSCSGSKPSTSQSCNTQACATPSTTAARTTTKAPAKEAPTTSYTYAFSEGSYGSCSQACGGGTRTRSVTCLRSDGQAVADTMCTSTKPSTSQSCNSQPCTTATTTPVVAATLQLPAKTSQAWQGKLLGALCAVAALVVVG